MQIIGHLISLDRKEFFYQKFKTEHFNRLSLDYKRHLKQKYWLSDDKPTFKHLRVDGRPKDHLIDYEKSIHTMKL
jgi:hypothetical protein